MKLQKYLSQSGVCSRRKAEQYIAAGEVFVNDEVAHIGQVIDPDSDRVRLGEKIIEDQKNLVYYKYHKPRGVVTSCADTHETAIMDVVSIPERVFPVGRLDKNTTGLILLTNDGRVTHRLLHPSFDHEKEYLVEVYGKISDTSLDRLRDGVDILGGRTKKCEIIRVSTGTFRIILTEGKNRQIRRMVEKVGHEVKKLKRIRMENIVLGDLEVGNFEPLSLLEQQGLLEIANAQNVDTSFQKTGFVSGEVIHGDGRGAAIGFPTANIAYASPDLTSSTYYCHVLVGENWYDGAGVFLPEKGVFEVHILGFDADIYGENLQVDIVDTIRDNRSFSSVDELKSQIEKDLDHIRSISTLDLHG